MGSTFQKKAKEKLIESRGIWESVQSFKKICIYGNEKIATKRWIWCGNGEEQSERNVRFGWRGREIYKGWETLYAYKFVDKKRGVA